MLLSTRSRARRTLSRWICVALESTETFAAGHSASRRAIVSPMTASKSGCMVGSPLPAKVITSGGVESATMRRRVASSCVRTSSRLLKRRPPGCSAFQPHSQ